MIKGIYRELTAQLLFMTAWETIKMTTHAADIPMEQDYDVKVDHLLRPKPLDSLLSMIAVLDNDGEQAVQA